MEMGVFLGVTSGQHRLKFGRVGRCKGRLSAPEGRPGLEGWEKTEPR